MMPATTPVTEEKQRDALIDAVVLLLRKFICPAVADDLISRLKVEYPNLQIED